ncbi:MAG: CDP-diacylglycerol--serine O-phosphatidyltransferase [Acidobacteriota bacterium]|nr:CDP-diacylglycerol--serine O-phosphatidyltransferase [Acidobacteriota bacterium]
MVPAKKRPRRAAYALPTLFTSGNIFLGFIALVQAFEGAMQAATGGLGNNAHYALAAKALGWAIFFDGLDGRIARMTNTTSDFGRELDSLADFITFGIAPAMLAFVWGVRYVAVPAASGLASHLTRAGYLVAFLYMLCGAVRLARFNVQTNPVPKNPGRPDRKYFVGMPSPAAAGLVASVVFFDSSPVRSLPFSITWLVVVGITGLLMVSTWRYPSFKQVSVSKPRTPLIVLIVGAVAFSIWEWSQPFLLAAASTYALSGIVLRVGGFVRRHKKVRSSAPYPEHQVG